MNVLQKVRKVLKSALIFAMVIALCGTTLAQAYASYFPIVVQHVFLDDAEKAKEEEAAKQGTEGEGTNTPEAEDSGLAEELKNLTSTHEVQMKGVYGGYRGSDGTWHDSNGIYGERFSQYEDALKSAEEAGNFRVDEERVVEGLYGSANKYQDVTLKTDIKVDDRDKEGGIAHGESAVEYAIDQLLSSSEEAAQLMSELQAAMSSGTLADKYDVERKLLALCTEQGLDVPTEDELNQFYPSNTKYIYDEDGNYIGSETIYDYGNRSAQAKAAEYKLNFITGFTAKFRQTCEAMAKEMPEAATLDLIELDSQDSSAAVQTVEDSLAANPAISDEQASAAAEVVADMLEVLDSWSYTSNGGTVKDTNVGLGSGSYGFREATNYLGGAEITEESKEVLLAHGYKSSSLEIQVVVQLWKDKLDADGNQVLDSKGRPEQVAYSKVFVSLDGESWTDADDPNGDPVDSNTVFASGNVELCTYTFTHSHRETAPLRPRPGVEPEEPKPEEPKPEDPKPDPVIPDPDPVIPDPDPVIPDPDPVIPDPDPVTPPEEENIPDPDVPLGEPELPQEEPPAEEPPEEIELEDPDVPLADIPETGDISDLWYGAALMAAAGLAALLYQDHRNKKTA